MKKIDIELKQICFHRDLDGVVAAAILLGDSEAEAKLTPVDYHMKLTWKDFKIEKPGAVVDFLFHPDAEIWIDHHPSPFLYSDWEKQFLELENPNHVWDSNAKSCPELILETFDLSATVKAHFEGYIEWSSIIDSALYESVEQAVDISNPYLLLSRMLSYTDDDSLPDIVKLISKHKVDDVVGKESVREARQKVEQLASEVTSTIAKFLDYDGITTLLDQSEFDWPYQRYEPYKIYPHSKYLVGSYRSGAQVKVSIGTNPWSQSTNFHVGELCEKWGGGGHRAVGGIIFDNLQEAKKAAKEIRLELKRSVSKESSTPG